MENSSSDCRVRDERSVLCEEADDNEQRRLPMDDRNISLSATTSNQYYRDEGDDDLFQEQQQQQIPGLNVTRQQQHPQVHASPQHPRTAGNNANATTPSNPLALADVVTRSRSDATKPLEPNAANSMNENNNKHRKRRPFLHRLTGPPRGDNNAAHSSRLGHPWDADGNYDEQHQHQQYHSNHRDANDDGGEEDGPHEEDSNHNYHHHAFLYNTPDFRHLFHLTAALLLCTCMAVLSALDAEVHCLQHEMYAVVVQQLVDNNYDDDDAAVVAASAAEQQSGESDTSSSSLSSSSDNIKCIQMFQDVVLPTGGATAISALIVLAILYRHNKSTSTTLAATAASDTPTAAESQSCCQVDDDDKDECDVPPPQKQWDSVVRVTVSLFFLGVIILGLQTYNVTAVMLKPRADLLMDGDEDDNDDSNSNNPYQSLAAVDRFGHVGDNANLYYLAWLSEGLAISLVYQVATACFRVVRAARRQQADSNSEGLMKAAVRQFDPCAYAKNTVGKGRAAAVELLRATSWERGGTDNNSQNRYLYRDSRSNMRMTDQSRAAWYSSLYRLRVRTGMWTAACISCLIIVASSQYIWRQVLWPFISTSMVEHQQQQESNNTETTKSALFSYFSVCRTTASQSSTYSTDFSPQLCRRTLAAWCSGLVAAVLCATAIVMHLVARYSSSTARDHHHAVILAAAAAAAATNSGGDGVAAAAETNCGHAYDYYDHDVIQLLTSAEDLCPKTTLAWKNAPTPAALLRRYYSHHHPKRLPLRTELLLGIMLSIVLGINAVLVTGVQGPALKVGNLYYSSWLSFLLCVRICLGCVEEFYNIDEEDDENDGITTSTTSDNTSATSGANVKESVTVAYQAPKLSGATVVPNRGIGETETPTNSVASKTSVPLSVDSTNYMAETQEKKRLGRVRGYFFLSIFSTVCAASSYDAASNQTKALSREQMCMMAVPCIVAVVSYLLFGLSLSKRCYSTISTFWIGGLLSIVSFCLWLGDLLLTMHSEDSWAVNSIGEIAMANLYYFAWASIITAGIQMTSYVKALLGIQKLDYMIAVWLAICKVCFVILGASLHIWHTISDNCEFDEITLGAVTFCSRTILAITVSLTGMLVGGLVVLGRLIVVTCHINKCARFQAHIEMLISLFLMFLFAAAVALITGIGGPGQSVGDLYYSTWLAFWVSLGIFGSCYHQLNEEEKELEGKKSPRTFDKPAAGGALV